MGKKCNFYIALPYPELRLKTSEVVWGLGVEATQMVVSELVTREIDGEAMPQPTDVQEPAIAQYLPAVGEKFKEEGDSL